MYLEKTKQSINSNGESSNLECFMRKSLFFLGNAQESGATRKRHQNGPLKPGFINLGSWMLLKILELTDETSPWWTLIELSLAWFGW